MKQIIYIIIGLTLIIGVWVSLLMSSFDSDDRNNAALGEYVVVASGGSITVGDTTVAPFEVVEAEKMTTVLTSGQVLSVNDVTKSSKSLGSNSYLLHTSEDKENLDFDVVYYADFDYFQITLEDEPLAEKRLAAQLFLANALGVTKIQLCELNASVKTTVYVNQFLAGVELGFPGCLGAVEL